MIKKITIILLLFITCLTLVACGDKEITPIINIDSEYDYVRVGEEMELMISSNLDENFTWSVDDDTLATIDEFGYIKGLSEGEVIVTAQNVIHPEYTKSITIKVIGAAVNKITVSGVNYGNIGETLTLKYTLFPKDIKSDYSVIIKDEGIATVNKDNSITLKNYGTTSVIVKALDDLEYTYEYKIVCCDFSKFYIDEALNNKYQDGDVVKYKGNDYYYGYTALSDFNDMTNKIIDNCTIEVAKGTYTDRLTIKKNNVTLITSDKAIIEGVVTLVEDVKNVTIDGFKFNGETAQIAFNGRNENVLIQNNEFINITGKTKDSFIYFKKNEKCYNNISITKNTFNGSATSSILINNMNNLKITVNTFKNCNGEAIYFLDASPSQSCQWLIKSNIFEKVNGIKTSKMSSTIVSYDTIISIFDNTFDNVKQCIYLDGNNNGTVCVDARYNDFINCINCVYIDTLENNTEKLGLHASFNYNNFTLNTCETYFITSDQTINTIDAQYNFYCAGETPVDFSKCTNAFSSNVNYTNRVTEKVQIMNSNKIYGKSALFTDEETSLSCEFADRFESSNTSIVTIDKDGKLTPIKEGKATITAYRESYKVNTFEVTVYGSLQVDYATELLKVAFTQEGYHEGANNLTKYGQWYGEQVNDKSFANGAWCAMFVTWCANQANIPTNVIPLYASCSAGRNWFETRGLFKYKENYKPKAGDIIFFLSNGASHTGIVISYDSKTGTVYTIEGNTSDMCAKRSYNWNNSRITGYGTPQYPKFEGKQTVEFDVSNATDGSNASTR